MQLITIGEYRYRILQTLNGDYQLQFSHANPILHFFFGWDNLGKTQSLESATDYLCRQIKKSTVYRSKE